MSDEIKTPRTDALSLKDLKVMREHARQIEGELVTAQARIRELEAAVIPPSHRTCTSCSRLLPAYLFPKLHGNESVCGECYFPCGGPKL